MHLFKENITNWYDWGQIFQSIPAFSKLIRYIFIKENLPFFEIEHLTPGSNAVFIVGDYVVKIYAPQESGMDQVEDFKTELYATKRAMDLGIYVPKIISQGFIEDSYHFGYIITEYIQGKSFVDICDTMSRKDRIDFSKRLRGITSILNTPCEAFNGIDIVKEAIICTRWKKYPSSFNEERVNFISSYNYSDKVFCHGDLCGDNILISPADEIFLIDFADSVYAPVIYEHAHIATELFNLDHSFLRGYFCNYSADDLADLCLAGLLVHDFGGDIIRQHIGEYDSFISLRSLREKIYERLTDNIILGEK